MPKKDKVRMSLRLSREQVQAVVAQIPNYPVDGVGQVTRSTVVGDLIDEHLLGKQRKGA